AASGPAGGPACGPAAADGPARRGVGPEPLPGAQRASGPAGGQASGPAGAGAPVGADGPAGGAAPTAGQAGADVSGQAAGPQPASAGQPTPGPVGAAPTPHPAGQANGLLRELVAAAERSGWAHPGPLLSNAIGFLSQTYDATAGLIGNTLVALARGADTPDTAALVREVARYDAPVQNTRRFAAEPFTHAGSTVEPGQQLLVVLAAANRDPAVNPDPHALSPGRVNPVVFTFGAGAHRCPGGELAAALATAVVAELRTAGWSTTATPAYRPLANARIPLL
ncbi:cytochrome P450, partial [Streptomyces sp. NPDC058157]|uniref:cytochrome P450 n=1 Tax=Streptomyces sp. NPDC058157 TaxID=3346360 RepID=UPI0036E527B8